MQIEFDELPLKLGNAEIGLFYGIAYFALDEDGNAYLERVEWQPNNRGNMGHTTVRGSGRKAATFETILLEQVEKSLWQRYQDELMRYEASDAVRELGYGHLQHERL